MLGPGCPLTIPARPPLWRQVTEVFSQTRNGEHVRITITLTNELPPTSPTCLQFYNIIFRRYVRSRLGASRQEDFRHPEEAT